MKKLFAALFLSITALVASVGDADAARLGGGKSVGMQRQAVSPKPKAPTQQVSPAAPGAPAAAPASAPKRNWLGPVAGLAAGLGLAALFSHFGLGAGFANLLTLALVAMAAVFVFRLLFRRSALTDQRAALQPQGVGVLGPLSETPRPSASTQPAQDVATPATIPAGFDGEAFVRVAKLNFIRLQAANDAGNTQDLREFLSPELFAEVRLQIDERGKTRQQTDVVTLEAEILEVCADAGRFIVSVRFSGMIRETPGAAALPFEEIWHLAKPESGPGGWIVHGIQQVGR